MNLHRDAGREDLAQIVAIYNATIPSRQVTAELRPVSVESRIPWFEAHGPERRPLWVIEKDGRIAAWFSFSDFHPREAYGRTAELSVYVHNDFRRQGLAAGLLAAGIAEAPKLGIDRLVGLIFAHNAPSLALFEAQGFERWAHLPGVAVLDGVRRDLVIVGRALA